MPANSRWDLIRGLKGQTHSYKPSTFYTLLVVTKYKIVTCWHKFLLSQISTADAVIVQLHHLGKDN